MNKTVNLILKRKTFIVIDFMCKRLRWLEEYVGKSFNCQHYKFCLYRCHMKHLVSIWTSFVYLNHSTLATGHELSKASYKVYKASKRYKNTFLFLNRDGNINEINCFARQHLWFTFWIKHISSGEPRQIR